MPGAICDEGGPESQFQGVEGGESDAVVSGKSGDKDVRHATVRQRSPELRLAHLLIVEKRRVRVHVWIKTLQDSLGPGHDLPNIDHIAAEL